MLSRVDETVADNAAARLHAFIADGNYGAGDRLPPERQLIELLGMGRGTLRRALKQLERDGLIWRHVGKGTFVARRHGGCGDLLANLARQMTPVRMMRARLCIEPAIAREAAINASREATAKIDIAVKRARAAASWAEYERQDDFFHRAVAEATDNLLLIGLFETLNRVQREVAWSAVERSTPRPPPDHSSFAEHATVARAIAAHDTEAAFQGMRAHLGSVSARLFGDA
ncbi:FadR/GntR family transcriptional regulator [Roseivivax sediminis]|uniref:DNA-binding transcriptional regulator, FadR family n=1 Tax=Roseivivax sediminis TaxID=936889 RepID=A0A1I2E9L2_9RHOB|nr:FCD domain-containing protein [Roseivivax sediminis]SFE89178.1 DNA-binding transcriptional regulator, FadR family [Roseivivax sediminis]